MPSQLNDPIDFDRSFADISKSLKREEWQDEGYEFPNLKPLFFQPLSRPDPPAFVRQLKLPRSGQAEFFRPEQDSLMQHGQLLGEKDQNSKSSRNRVHHLEVNLRLPSLQSGEHYVHLC